MPRSESHRRKPPSRSAVERHVADLAGLYGWRHHHASPGRTVADYSDGFPSEVLLRGGRLILLTIVGAGGSLVPPDRVWVEELRDVRAVEALVIPRDADALAALTRALRSDTEAETPRRSRCVA